MDIRQLRAFNAVMETGFISEAARKLCVTQPAVSKTIRALESEVGMPLFSRETGRLKPTPEAQYLQGISRNIFNQLNDAKRFLRDYRDLNAGDIMLLSIPGPTLFFLPRVIADFIQDRKKINVSLLAWATPQVINWVANHQIGIGVAEWFEPHPSLEFHPVALRCLCALPKGHALANCEVITPSDLNEVPMASINTDHPIHSDVRRAFREARCKMNIRFQSDLFVSSFTFLESINLINIVDPISATSYEQFTKHDPQIVFRRFEPEVFLHLSIVSPAHRPLSRVSSAFRDELIGRLEALSDFSSNR